MRILGIDPGSRVMGYGIIDKNGNKLTHVENGAIFMKKELLSVKLKIIYDQLFDVIKKYMPDVMVIESVFYGKNVQSTIKLSHARAIPILLAQIYDLPIYQFTPLEVKKSVVGYGRADKKQIQNMVKLLLNLPEIAQEDASDAVAVAIAFANLSNFQKDKHIL